MCQCQGMTNRLPPFLWTVLATESLIVGVSRPLVIITSRIHKCIYGRPARDFQCSWGVTMSGFRTL